MNRHRLEILESVPSTMAVARLRIQSGQVAANVGLPAPYSGVLALEQTEGRGQRGRAWTSRRGASLCATFYFRYGLDLPAQSRAVSLLAGVAVAKALTEMFPAHSADIGLKWPNDLLVDGRKAGGILIETAHSPDGQTVLLIGIGINLSNGAFPPELANSATTLSSAGLIVSDVASLAEQVAASLARQAELFLQKGMPGLVNSWREFDRTVGRRFETQLQEESVTGIAEGIDDDGQLLLRLPDNTLLHVLTASSLREAAH